MFDFAWFIKFCEYEILSPVGFRLVTELSQLFDFDWFAFFFYLFQWRNKIDYTLLFDLVWLGLIGDFDLFLNYYMARSRKDWELRNSRIWLAKVDIDCGQDFPI